jgi:hypothetical protein
VISTQPEQVPVLQRYLPAGLVYLTSRPDPARFRSTVRAELFRVESGGCADVWHSSPAAAAGSAPR